MNRSHSPGRYDLAEFGRPRLLVIGDLMLDRYTQGNVERVSPEAPVLVLRGETDDVRPGGAANVASFLRGLDCDVTLVGAVGDDADGRTLRRVLGELPVDAEGILTVDDRPTTSKHRLVGRTFSKSPQQLLRVDHESRVPLSPEATDRLRQAVEVALPACDAVLLSDYAKGTLTPRLARDIIDLARRHDRPVLVDPSRESDWAAYAGATLVSPNRRAAEIKLGRSLADPDAILDAATELRQRFDLEVAAITLDRDGIALATHEESEIVPCHPREVCDVTGAGDMVLAVLGLCATGRFPWRDSAEIANAAAGLEVERFGVEPLTRDEIAAELEHRQTRHSKLLSLDDAISLGHRYRQAGRSLVFTNGCFDLLHVGHVTLLEEASRLGDVLIVAINSDDSVRRLKGASRPIIGEQDRARMLGALSCVDHVLIFDDDTPHRLLERIRPDVLVKGGTTDAIVGREIVESYGGYVTHTRHVAGLSTTNVVQRLQMLAERRPTS